MNRSISNEKLLEILSDKPATVRNLVNPSPELLANAIAKYHKTLLYIPSEWLTIEVLIAYAKNLTKRDNLYTPHETNFKAFKYRVKEAIPEQVLRDLCKVHPSVILYFPEGPHDLWLDCLASERIYVDFKQIPEQQAWMPVLIV